MKKSFIVIGLGRFGMSVIKTLNSLTSSVIGVDIDESRVLLASQEIEKCYVCDCTKMSTLEELGAKNVDHAIVSIGNNLQATILTTINLKELGVKKITVRIDDKEYENVMERLGADEIIIPEGSAGSMFARQIMSDTILDFYSVDKDYAVVQMSVKSSFKEVTLGDLNARNEFDINIVGITRNGKFFLPKGNDKIQPNDVVMVVGKTTKINKFDRRING